MTKLMTMLAAVSWLAACSLQPDAPPRVLASAYGGMGDVVGKCMQYASESYCVRQAWGSDEQD